MVVSFPILSDLEVQELKLQPNHIAAASQPVRDKCKFRRAALNFTGVHRIAEAKNSKTTGTVGWVAVACLVVRLKLKE